LDISEFARRRDVSLLITHPWTSMSFLRAFTIRLDACMDPTINNSVHCMHHSRVPDKNNLSPFGIPILNTIELLFKRDSIWMANTTTLNDWRRVLMEEYWRMIMMAIFDLVATPGLGMTSLFSMSHGHAGMVLVYPNVRPLDSIGGPNRFNEFVPRYHHPPPHAPSFQILIQQYPTNLQ
jgi:hypothetical protein